MEYLPVNELSQFCANGGCMAKFEQEKLNKVLEKIPRSINERLLVGFERSDDAAVYKLTEDLAIVQTLDFFTPIVDDPYLFGKIAAANAMSDVYAMGGEVATAMNIVCFPEKMDIGILSEILKGGAEKVAEAGGVLCGGHTINDKEPKYGLSVTGTVNPRKIWKNTGSIIGDKLILTKPLGVGIVTTAYKIGEGSIEAYNTAVNQMVTLNKSAADIISRYKVHAATDVTGFGFLGHLYEMCEKNYTIQVNAQAVNYIPEAYDYAKEFIISACGQKNRNYLGDCVIFEGIDYAMQEILFDPQTSGGIIVSVPSVEADRLLAELNRLDIKSCVVAEVIKRGASDIIVGGAEQHD